MPVEYDPGEQRVQAPEPELDENWPEGQGSHCSAPDDANFPGGHGVHVEDPRIELKVPKGQGSQEEDPNS